MPSEPAEVGQHEVLELNLGPVAIAAPHAVEIEVSFVGPTGRERRVPAFAGGPRVVYVPSYATSFLSDYAGARLRGLGGRRWRMDVLDPRNGEVDQRQVVEPDRDGTALLRAGHLGLTMVPGWDDWLLVLRPEA